MFSIRLNVSIRFRQLFKILAGFAIVFATSARAATVAFLELRDPLGRQVKLTEGSSFAHVAIAFRGGWLHSWPHKPVEIIASLEDISSNIIYLTNADVAEPTQAEVDAVLAKEFDHTYHPANSGKMYCSLLVQQLFGLELSKMEFTAANWRTSFHPIAKGHLGTSPAKIYDQLLERGWVQSAAPACVGDLRWPKFVPLPTAMPIKYVPASSIYEGAKEMGVDTTASTENRVRKARR